MYSCADIGLMRRWWLRGRWRRIDFWYSARTLQSDHIRNKRELDAYYDDWSDREVGKSELHIWSCSDGLGSCVDRLISDTRVLRPRRQESPSHAESFRALYLSALDFLETALCTLFFSSYPLAPIGPDEPVLHHVVHGGWTFNSGVASSG